MLLALVLPACQLPFDEDRHDLASFRIAGVTARMVDDDVVAVDALVWSGHGAWHDPAPTLVWEATGPDGAPLTADGPTVTFPAAWPLSLSLTASGDLGEERAVLDLGGAPHPPVVAAWSRGVTDLTLADLALSIDDRLSHAPGDDAPVAAGGGLRLALDVVDDGPRTTHWMATGGQFAELDPATTDWFAGTATVDDGEVLDPAPATAGVYPAVALTFDGEGGNAWTFLDLAVDVAGPLLRVAGRVFPVDTAERGEGWWEATLVQDDSAAGVAFTDLAPADPPGDDADPVCGAAPTAGFDPATLFEGWCARSDVLGARVRVYGEITP